MVPEVVRAQPLEWPRVKFWFYQFVAVKLILQGSGYSCVKWTKEGSQVWDFLRIKCSSPWKVLATQ